MKLKRWAYQREQGLMKYYEEWQPSYPVDGMSLDDLTSMLGQIEKQRGPQQDKRVLTVDMMDRDHVLIQTGIM